MQVTKFVLVAAILISTTLFAQSSVTSHPTVNWERAVQNYLKALSSENSGVRESAVDFLDHYRLKGTVPELISVLQTDTAENNRMAAALTLVLIGEKEGINAVEKGAVNNGNERVAKFCGQILNATGKGETLGVK